MKNPRTRILIIGLVVILVVSVIFRLLTPINKIPPQPVSLQPVWNNFLLGYSTATDVQKKLGAPINTESTTLGTYYDYPSDYQALPQQVLIKDGKVVLIKQRIGPRNISSFQQLISSLGKEEAIQYTPGSGGIFPLYIYASKGIAISKSSDNEVMEIWFFNPISIESFKSTFGTENSDSETSGPELPVQAFATPTPS